MLKEPGLVGSMVYYDGAHNDSRMNVALILTAISKGATALNHMKVISLIKKPVQDKPDVICGARVKDTLTGEEMDISCKVNKINYTLFLTVLGCNKRNRPIH